MKNFINKWIYLLITVFCSLAVIITVYVLKDVAPFGDNSLLTIDFFHQYGPMLGELYNRVWNGLNLIYSFNMGMGLPFFRNFFNYLSSPFNIIILLFKHKDLLMSYSVIIGLKAVASSCTMVYYLNHKFGKNYLHIALAILYAFCAYFTAYYWNIMWLDGLVLLPLVTYGIELLVNKNKVLLYVISLALMIFSNYFIGYMICIFSLLYFLFYLFIETKIFNIKKILLKVLYFGISSLIAGGLCALFLIPMYYALRGISATSDIWPSSQYYAFSLKDFIFNHFSGVGSTVLKSGITTAPNISVGVLPIALLILFIINPEINLKVKIGYFVLLVILTLSYVIAPLDFIWHAFHVPNDLPYRYSFLYSFIMIIISGYSLKYIKNVKSLYVGIIYGLMLIFITIMKHSGYENINSDMILMNYIIITICYLSYIIYKYFNKYKKYSVIFIIICSCLECIMVINNNWDINQSIEGFYNDYDSMKDVIDYLKDNDKSMYRIERDSMLTFNDPSWYNYYGQIAFSSMEYENMAILNHSLGMPGNEINSFYYKQNTPIYDMMFNIKYLIGHSKDADKYSLYYSNDYFDVYRNNYNIGLMFGADQSIIKWENNFENPFLNQNDFIFKASGVSNVLEEIPVKGKIIYDQDDKQIVKYTVKDFNDNYYTYFYDTGIDFIVVDNDMYYAYEDYDYANNCSELTVSNHYDYNERFIINRKGNGTFNIYVGYNGYYNDNLLIYKVNKDKLNDVYSFFIDKKISITSFKENYIKAFYDSNEKMTIYTSIPYDKGWNVYIDGRKVKTYELANTLLAFDVDEGQHDIEIKYHIDKFDKGLIISLMSLVELLLFVKLKKKDN